jgi:lipopolysaccharide export system permease protein
VTLFVYLLRQMLLSMAFSLGGIALVVFPALTVSAVHRLRGAGIETIIMYLPLVAMDLVPYLLPLSFMLAVVATFGRLAADREWTAIQAAGIHPLRMLLPGLVLATTLAGGTYWMVSTVAPEWTHRQRSYHMRAVAQALTTLFPGRTRIQVGDFLLEASRRTENTFYDVLIFLPRKEGVPTKRMVADEVHMGFDGEVLRMSFVQARVVHGRSDATVGRPSLEIPLEELVQEPRSERTRATDNTSAVLKQRLAEGDLPPDLVLRYRYEIQARRALSVCYLLFLALGAPTGIWLRKGTQLAAMAASVAYALVYYVLSMNVGQELVFKGQLEPWVGAWATTVLGLIPAVWLLRRAARP